MELRDGEVFAERIQDEEANHILFHLNHDPYSIYCFSMDEDWKSTPFVRHECSFIPKTIRTFKKYPYTLISSTKTVSVINSVILFFLCFYICSLFFLILIKKNALFHFHFSVMMFVHHSIVQNSHMHQKKSVIYIQFINKIRNIL